MITDWQSKILRTITLRPGQRSCVDYINMFHQQGIRIGKIARTLLSQECIPAVTHESKESLLTVSNADLGCIGCYTLEETISLGLTSGLLEYCSVEAVLQLRLEYIHQPMGERLIVCTKPVRHTNGGTHLFSIEHDQYGLWIYSYPYNPKDFRNGINRFLWQYKQ